MADARPCLRGQARAKGKKFQNMPMLYTPAWNGLVEGPTWGAWWIQNSYGSSYCALPFWHEPWVFELWTRSAAAP